MRIMFIVLFITSGIYFFRTGLRKFDSYLHRNEWPPTEVKIISTEIQDVEPMRHPLDDIIETPYSLFLIKYEYSVRNKKYTSIKSFKYNEAFAMIQKLERGELTQIYSDPKYPEIAVFTRGNIKERYFLIPFGLSMLCLSFGGKMLQTVYTNIKARELSSAGELEG